MFVSIYFPGQENVSLGSLSMIVLLNISWQWLQLTIYPYPPISVRLLFVLFFFGVGCRTDIQHVISRINIANKCVDVSNML